ncbi:hypothetical protein JCM11641_007168 [Rhodosporidiobolus odoratus]
MVIAFLLYSSAASINPLALTTTSSKYHLAAFLRLQRHSDPQPLAQSNHTLSGHPPQQLALAAAREIDFLTPLPRPDRVSDAPAWVLSKSAAQLPACKRIMLFTFMPWWGFASEYILYARAAAAAKRMGYTLVEDDNNWNYGHLSNYFEPRKLDCVPPTDWADHRKAYPFRKGSNWRGRSRLRYSRAILSNLDDWTREEYLAALHSKQLLGELRKKDRKHAEKQDRWILEEGGTLPRVFEPVFDDQAKIVRNMWQLTADMVSHVDEVKRRTGLDKVKRLAGEDGEKKRGPLIALHIRLGDKASEYEHDSAEMGITNTFGNLTVYIEAAHDAYRRLIPSRYSSLSTSSSRFTPYARPSLLLITAEPEIRQSISSIPLAGPFEVFETPPPDVRTEEANQGTKERLGEAIRAEIKAEEEGEAGPKAYLGGAGGHGAKMLKLSKPNVEEREVGKQTHNFAKRATASPEPTNLSAGYTQAAFNALPLLERVVHTQAFVRDLTIIAREVDAAVVSGASNVGRLAMLIAGKDAVTGPVDTDGHALGGRIRSVDAHFYPTAYSSAVYTAIKDVEDKQHAAFLPEEQHAAEQKIAEEKRLRRKKEKEKARLGHL